MTENSMNVAPQPQKNSAVTLVLGTVLIVAIVGLVALQFMQRQQTPSSTPVPLEVEVVNEQETMIPTEDSSEEMSGEESNVKVFEIEAGSYYYQPAEIRVKKGDTVRIVLKSVDMMHNFAIDAYGIHSPVVPAGESTTIEFVADEVGSFEYYCSVMQHRQMGQVGMLIVEE